MLTFRIGARQRRFMFRAVLVGVGISAAWAVLGQLIGHRPQRGLAMLLIVLPILLFFSFATRAAFTSLDGSGVRTRMYCFATRSCRWGDVADIQVRITPTSAGDTRTVRVTRVNGRHFTLGAPMTGAALRDDEFDAKAEQILAFWRAQVPDHVQREIAVSSLLAPKTRRRVRIGGSLLLVVAVGLVIGAVVQSISGIDVLEHGVRTTAVVLDIDRSSKNAQYLLQVDMADGTENEAWTGAVSGTRIVGDRIAVAYAPSDPSTVKTVDEVGRWWINPGILVVVATVFAWFGMALWRLKPVGFLSRRQ